MKKLARRSAPLVAVAVLGALLLVAAASGHGNGKASSNAGIKACALLPDTTSSTRYTLFDAPYLKAAFKKANVPAQVLNALGDSQKQTSQAQQCLARGAKVILLDQLNAASGTAITNLAVSRGAKVIDYDRLVVGSKAAYYVSFNNPGVGKLMGLGLIAALKAKGKYGSHPVVGRLNGGITDNNAKLFRQGYTKVLTPLWNNGTFKKADGEDQYSDWNPIKGRQIFDQMLARNGNKIDAMIAANDGLAGAIIASLKAHSWQSGTVYKSVKREAAAAATLAIKIIKHQKVSLPAIAKTYKGATQKVSGTPSVLLTPVWITKKNYKLLFADGFLKRSQVCIGEYKKYCK
jgi:D-xylose transport system substrate-binding protein